MDSPGTPLGTLAPLRHWLARHLIAIVATAIVLTTLGWKNQYHQGSISGGVYYMTLGGGGSYGWPRKCVDRFDNTPAPYVYVLPRQVFTLSESERYKVGSWLSLLLDALIAVMSLVATSVLLSRTQRRCQQWWQVSLSTVVGFVILAAVVCTVLKSQALWGW